MCMCVLIRDSDVFSEISEKDLYNMIIINFINTYLILKIHSKIYKGNSCMDRDKVKLLNENMIRVIKN